MSENQISKEQLLEALNENPELTEEFLKIMNDKLLKEKVLEEQPQEEEEKHSIVAEEQPEQGEEKHSIVVEEQPQEEEEKHSIVVEKKRKKVEEQEEQKQPEEKKQSLSQNHENKKIGEGMLFFCHSEQEAQKKLLELKEKYPDKEFVIKPITQKEFLKLKENKVRNDIKKAIEIKNDELAENILKELVKEGEVQLNNFPIKDKNTGEKKILKVAKLKLEEQENSDKLKIKIQYVINPNKPDEIYVNKTGQDNGKAPDITIQTKGPSETKTVKVSDSKADEAQKIKGPEVEKEERKRSRGHNL